MALVALAPMASQAGIPTTSKLICPIGGERFEITESLSCSQSGERTMSMAPVSTCDFVTRLPQCPQNFLPMYKEFTEADLGLLGDYMVTESYDSNVDRSRYYLAYNIERYIGELGTSDPFLLLLHGLWYDPENTFSDEIYMSDFFFEAQSELRRAVEADLPYLKSMLAFAYAKVGEIKEARVQMSEAIALEQNGFLTVYHRGIEACIAKPSSEFCSPTMLIPAN